MLKSENITKEFSRGRGVRNVTASISRGEIVCVLGPSGSGKSTLSRCLAGLEKPDSGTLEMERGCRASYVSQEYTLWPHLTVLKNLTLVPVVRGLMSEESAGRAAKELLRRFGLEDYHQNHPHELSGGQRQRVAILRAVMVKPDILILDEITSALDPELTKSVLNLMRGLAKDKYTMIIVTHHVAFAMAMADRIWFLKNGEITQDNKTLPFFSAQEDPEIRSYILDIAKKDDAIEVFKGAEQFQSYHLQLLKRLPEESTIHVVGGVGDSWTKQMGEFYGAYQDLRRSKRIVWKMVTYEQGSEDRRLALEHPELNQFRKLPRSVQNPANYNVFDDTVITQIFGDVPSIIQVKNKHVASAYLRFFEDLWAMSGSETPTLSPSHPFDSRGEP